MAKHLAWLTLLLVATYFQPQPASADLKVNFVEIYRLFNNGAYAQAVENLSAINVTHLSLDEKIAIAYWKGLCFSKMQTFDRAVTSLQEAVRLGGDYKDLYYELGQALYASQLLRPALAAFEKSVNKKYKIGASMYYKGFINQILEDYSAAISTYKAILRQPDDPDKVKEGSLLQIAELELSTAMAEKNLTKRKARLAKRVIPAFQDVIDYVDSGPAADEARRSLLALQPQIDELQEEKIKFLNGVPISSRSWTARAIQDFKYDSNVIFQPNGTLRQISNTGSPVSRTNVEARYDYILDRRYVLSSEVDVNYTRNLNRTEPAVITNDFLSITGFLRSRLEHTVFSAPSAMTFDLEYNYTLRDYLSLNDLPYYSSYLNFTYGNRIQFLPFGSTSLNLNAKWFFSVDSGQNSSNPAIVLTQNFNLGKIALTESLAYDFNYAPNNTIFNRSDYHITSALNIPEVFWKSTLSIVLDLTLVDTQNQFITRGLEKTISPSVTLTRRFNSGVSVNCSYSYTKNVIGVGVVYRM